MFAVIALLGAACSTNGENEQAVDTTLPASTIEVSGDVTGDVKAVPRTNFDFPVDVDGVEPLTETIEVTTTGQVDGDIEIRIPAPGVTVDPDEVVFALAAASPGDPVDIVPAEIRDGYVVITTTHFSLFQAFKGLIGGIGETLRAAAQGLTSQGAAEASPPECADEDNARTDGYEVSSDSGDALF